MDLSSEKARFDVFVESEKAIEDKLNLPDTKGVDLAMDVTMGIERGKIFPPFGIIEIDEKYDTTDKIFDLANSIIVNAKNDREKLETLPINSKQLITMVTSLNEFEDSPINKDIENKTGESIGELVKHVEEIKNGNRKIEDFDNLKGFKLPDLEEIIKSSLQDFLSSIGIKREDYSQTTIDRSKQIIQNFNNTSAIGPTNNTNNISKEISNKVENLTSLNTENTSVNNEGNYFEGTNSTISGDKNNSSINNATDQTIKNDTTVTNLQTYNTISSGSIQNVSNSSIVKDSEKPLVRTEVPSISVFNEVKPSIAKENSNSTPEISKENVTSKSNNLLELNNEEPRIDNQLPTLSSRDDRKSTPAPIETQQEEGINKSAEPSINSNISNDSKKEEPQKLSTKEPEEKNMQLNTEKIERLLMEISNKLSQPILTIDSKINYS